MATLYWLGTTNDDWDTAGNWSQSSGGAANGWVPTDSDAVVFDENGTNNCTLAGDVEIAGFSLDADKYTGTLDWANHNILCHGGFTYTAASPKTRRWVNQGGVTIDTNGPLISVCDRRLAFITIKAGVTLTNASISFVYCNKLTIESGASLLRFRFAIGVTESDVLDLADDVSYTSTTFQLYPAESIVVTQKKVRVPGCAVAYNYTAGWTVKMTGDLECGALTIHGSATSSSPETAGTLDMNGHNVTCTKIVLGLSNVNYYYGQIKLGSGTHTTGYIASGGVSSGGYVDWGSCEIELTDKLSLEGITQTGNAGATLTLTGTSNISINSNGNQLPDVAIQRTGGLATLADDLLAESCSFTSGDLDLAGYNVETVGDFNASDAARFWSGTDADMGGSVITVGGALNLAGKSGSLLLITNLNFEANGPSAKASYCDVTGSDNSGIRVIRASIKTNTDGGGNVGWDFYDPGVEGVSRVSRMSHIRLAPYAITNDGVVEGDDASPIEGEMD